MPGALNIHDVNATETQLMLFVKECILPVAMQTKALILVGGCTDDSLAMAVQKVMEPIQNRMGASCPFTIIGFCFSFEVHMKGRPLPLSLKSGASELERESTGKIEFPPRDQPSTNFKRP